MAELETLSFKKIDLEPDEVPAILVPLGESSYKAHCPNDYEFIALMQEVRKLQDDPSVIDMAPILGAFFASSDVRLIDKKCRTGEIDFIAELSPALTALADHFRPFVEKRLNAVQKKLASPKAR